MSLSMEYDSLVILLCSRTYELMALVNLNNLKLNNLFRLFVLLKNTFQISNTCQQKRQHIQPVPNSLPFFSNY